MTRPPASLRAAPLALVFFGLLAFFNAIRHPFVHDDVIFILNNPHITELDHWLGAFSVPAATGGLNTYYRPLLEVFYRLEYHFLGPHPFGYHLINVIVHIANGLLLFGLMQKLGLARHVAWVIALLFLIHPVQTEAVCCISGISNLWMAMGVLLALHAYLNKWYAASFLCYVFAFLGKEQAVMFVPLVMVIDFYNSMSFPRKRESFIYSWILWMIATCILLWLRQAMSGGASLLKDIMASPGELYLRLAAVPRDIGMDLQLIFFPYGLHYYRSTDILQSNNISWLLALIAMVGVFEVYHRWPQARLTLILGLGWFLAALLPVLNIAPLINEYSFILTPEHFLYLPIVGILIIVVVAADAFRFPVIPAKGRIDRHSQLLAGILKKLLLSLVVAGCLSLTWYQNTFWGSETALFERMLRFEPNFGRGHLLLAKAYYFNGRPDLAEGHFKKSFTIMSGYAGKATNQTAENFYIRYEKEILFYWARNENALGHLDPAFIQARSNIQHLNSP